MFRATIILKKVTSVKDMEKLELSYVASGNEKK